MTVNYTERYAVHPDDYEIYNTAMLRENFLVNGIFKPGAITLVYTQIDRFIVGGACPAGEPLKLDTIDALKATHFLNRRELGAVNVGGVGRIRVDGETYDIAFKEALYVGAGAKEVIFESIDAANPAKFYLNSATAHHSYPNKKVGLDDAIKVELGSLETSNHRVINKLIVNGVVDTCQLQMGMTELKSGSVWNTMPAHTHSRRMETYFYFEVPEGQAVCHFMGTRDETRHLWMANEQAVISPTWSLHSGAGTSNYTFIWGMAGENLDYDDMDKIQPTDFTQPDS